jgi:hypothetical protein
MKDVTIPPGLPTGPLQDENPCPDTRKEESLPICRLKILGVGVARKQLGEASKLDRQGPARREYRDLGVVRGGRPKEIPKAWIGRPVYYNMQVHLARVILAKFHSEFYRTGAWKVSFPERINQGFWVHHQRPLPREDGAWYTTKCRMPNRK